MISGLFFVSRNRRDGRSRARTARRRDEHHLRLSVCAFLPAIGMLTAFIPNLKNDRNLPPAQPVDDFSRKSMRSDRLKTLYELEDCDLA